MNSKPLQDSVQAACDVDLAYQSQALSSEGKAQRRMTISRDFEKIGKQ